MTFCGCNHKEQTDPDFVATNETTAQLSEDTTPTQDSKTKSESISGDNTESNDMTSDKKETAKGSVPSDKTDDVTNNEKNSASSSTDSNIEQTDEVYEAEIDFSQLE